MAYLLRPLLCGWIGLALLGVGGFSSFAQEAPSPEELAGAVRTEGITVPTPGELFAALKKRKQVNWPAYYREPIPTNFPSRVRIALNLGSLVADGYVAVEAMDSQQVKNIGRDLTTLAKSLGVSDNLISRGNSIAEFADANEWNALMEELDATQNEVKNLMEGMRDKDLVVLVNLGGWIRGAEVVSSAVLDDYRPDAARVLRQPALVAFLRTKLDALSERNKTDPIIVTLREQLIEIENLLNVPQQSEISEATVENLRDLTGAIIAEISKKN